tara:strand:- start:164 stop:412 length:249 start_codon:yes stop_codon:yes gene_type:complete
MKKKTELILNSIVSVVASAFATVLTLCVFELVFRYIVDNEWVVPVSVVAVLAFCGWFAFFFLRKPFNKYIENVIPTTTPPSN